MQFILIKPLMSDESPRAIKTEIWPNFETRNFGQKQITIHKSDQEGKLDLTPVLSQHDKEYLEVAMSEHEAKARYVFSFGTELAYMRTAEMSEEYSENNYEQLKRNGIFITEYEDNRTVSKKAQRIAKTFNWLTQKLINNKNPQFNPYKSPSLYMKYRANAEEAYRLLVDLATKNGVKTPGEVNNAIIVKRAGIKSTQLARKYSVAESLNELPIDVKRMHFLGEKKEEGELSVIVDFSKKDLAKAKQTIHGRPLDISDFVVASGASGVAVLLALDLNGIKPSEVIFRSAAMTPQGVEFTREVCKSLNIPCYFLTNALTMRLNDNYYLINPRGVGDAGDWFEYEDEKKRQRKKGFDHIQARRAKNAVRSRRK